MNAMNEPISWDAPDGYAVVGALSYHRNREEDRRWVFRYAKINGLFTFHGRQNLRLTDYDKPMIRQCWFGFILTSFTSWYDNGKEDRRWNFRCSSVRPKRAVSCKWTSYLNDWDDVLDYHAPADYVITGVRSYHHNQHGDRRFSFKVCKIINSPVRRRT